MNDKLKVSSTVRGRRWREARSTKRSSEIENRVENHLNNPGDNFRVFNAIKIKETNLYFLEHWHYKQGCNRGIKEGRNGENEK